MILITWNTQWCRGVDGRVDPERIVREARGLADFDVLCLQEIASNFPEPRLGDSRGEDQFAAIAAMLPGYTAIPGIAVDHPGDGTSRRQFGNMILSRLPVRQAFRHLLPFPVDAGINGMPRIAVEAVVAASFGEIRIATTHLEYYSQKQRGAQVEGLRAIYAEGHAHARAGSITDTTGSPFNTYLRPKPMLICGDFNLEPDDALHARMCAPFDDGTPPLHDAWEALHSGKPHPPTFCLFQKTDPSGGVLHCDFVFVNDDARAHLDSIHVDQHNQAADHQPVIVRFR